MTTATVLLADIVAAPSGAWRSAVTEIDPKLFDTPYPSGFRGHFCVHFHYGPVTRNLPEERPHR